jgi:two-component system OmpR family response regulator
LRTHSEDTAARRVLVADDEPAMRLLCRVNLPLAGFEVVEAVDGESALAQLRGERFDLALLDVMMPGVNGFGVAERLRDDGVDVPIVFLSARADGDDIRRGLALGAIDYVTKPFDPLRIGERLHEVLRAFAAGSADELRAKRLRELDRR